jgi:hypothetical protein
VSATTIAGLLMTEFLLSIARKIINDAVSKLPDNAELGEKLVDIVLTILRKAVKLTKTTVDDELLHRVEEALKGR